MQQETREGVHFYGYIGRMSKNKFAVHLFIEKLAVAVGTVKFCLEERGFIRSSPGILVDKAFQKWVTEGWFKKTVTDSNLFSVLKIAQRERLDKLPGNERTFRFLPAVDCSSKNLHFILTADKSDIQLG